jgi:cell division transport system permease protein
MLGFLVSEALRDLRRAGHVAVSAILLITLSLVALGAFRVLSANVGRAVAQWRDRVKITVYLKREPSAAEAAALLQRVRNLPDVAAATYVSKAEALSALKRVLGKDASVAEQLPTNPLPASIDVTPAPSGTTVQGAPALLARLSALPEAEEIAGGVDWVDRLADWQRLLTTVGLGVGGLLALAAILTVTTATTLVLHARRHETEIMRLVGAPEIAIRLPLLLQGMLQGLVGAVGALAVLLVGYRVIAPRMEGLVNVTLGLARLDFLSPPDLAILLASGTLLGAMGGWLARGRREP